MEFYNSLTLKASTLSNRASALSSAERGCVVPPGLKPTGNRTLNGCPNDVLGDPSRVGVTTSILSGGSVEPPVTER